MFAGRPWSDWITDYGKSHQNPVNRVCHTIGIPLIMLSFPLLFLLLVDRGLWIVPLGTFLSGWILQFVGHASRASRRSSSRTGASCSSAPAGGSPRSVAGSRDY